MRIAWKIRFAGCPPLTAREVVNTYSYSELVKIFFRYGEEKFSKQIAREIERVREKQPIETTV